LVALFLGIAAGLVGPLAMAGPATAQAVEAPTGPGSRSAPDPRPENQTARLPGSATLSRLPEVPPMHAHRLKTERRRRPAAPKRVELSWANDESSGRSRFDKALIGSSIGVAIGGLLGTALIAGANGEDRPGSTVGRYGDDDGDRLALGATGLLFIVAGGPVGAVRNADIRRGRFQTYAVSVLGELLVGGAAAALGAAIGRGETGQAVGAIVFGAPGAALGAAGGAVIGAPSRTRSAVHLDASTGSWTIQVPTVHVAPHPGPAKGVAGRASLITIDL
jgi:hypothetical protein